MRRVTRILILLFTVLALGNLNRACPQAPAAANESASPTPSRLAVFEIFTRAT